MNIPKIITIKINHYDQTLTFTEKKTRAERLLLWSKNTPACIKKNRQLFTDGDLCIIRFTGFDLL
jgi:hypothetical protein